MIQVDNLIESCAWASSHFAFFSANVFDPLVYYSHLFPAVLSLVIGGLLFWGNRHRIENKILFGVLCLFSLWCMFDLILWATPHPSDTVFFWSLVNMLEPLVYAGALCFAYAFVSGSMPSARIQRIIFFMLVPVILLAPTALNIAGFDLTNCDREAVQGILIYYGFFIEIIFAVWIIAYGVIHARIATWDKKRQITLCTAGLALFLLSFSLGNIVGSVSENWIVGQIGLFGMPILVLFLSILAGRYQAFKTKAFSAELLVVTLWVLIISMMFVQDIQLLHLVLLITFLVTLALGILLIRSVKREIAQKENLSEFNKRLTTLDATKNEFLSFATHQLRSPLTSIKWGLASMKEGYSDETADKLLATTDDLIGTVNDLLDISKIEQGGLVMKMEEFDLHDFVGRVVEEFRRTAEKKGLRLAFTGDIVPCFVVADENKLRQVFVNLIDNAIKYTAKGDIKVVFRRVGKTAEVSVWDTGAGIAPEEIKDLFDKFLRGAAGKASQGGSGLGLYLAKKIVEAHHGQMRAASPGVGRGSIFTVTLPLKS